MTVRVYVGNILFDEVTFATDEAAQDFADEQQDNGLKVRIV